MATTTAGRGSPVTTSKNGPACLSQAGLFNANNVQHE